MPKPIIQLALVAALSGCGDNAALPDAAPPPCTGELAGGRCMFNGRDFTGWYTWLPSQGRSSDPLGMFRYEDGMVHILGSDVEPAQFEFGYLATEKEYESFHVRFEYKFGERHYVNFPKDSGFFVAVVGEDRIWPRSQECQVMVMDTGSMYMFEHATIETTIDPNDPNPRYLEGGAPHTSPRVAAPYPRVTHNQQRDIVDDWNTVEVIVDGASSEFIVNGFTTFRSTARKQPHPDFPDDPAQDIPLTKGRILIQQEGAEIYYRNVEIKER